MLLVVALVVTPAVLHAVSQPKVYESTAEVLVRPIALTGDASDEAVINMVPEQRIAESAQVSGLVERKMGSETPAAIAVSAPLNANTMVFTASSNDAQTATDTAQAYAESYLQVRNTMGLAALTALRRPLLKQQTTLNEQILTAQEALATSTDPRAEALLTQRIDTLENELSEVHAKLVDIVEPGTLSGGQVITPAALPEQPSSPKPARTAMLAFVLGVGLAVAIALLRDRLDRRVRRTDEVAVRVRAPVLAVVPVAPVRRGANGGPRPVVDDPTYTQAFRTLRATIEYIVAEDGVSSILVTSPTTGDGKTSTVANLGAALARGGRSVVMVASDLRHQDLRSHFVVRSDYGLTTALVGDRAARNVLVAVSDGLYLLDSGPDTAGAAELLGSPAMASVIADLEQFADVVLLDAPAVLNSADALALAPIADATLVVVDAERASVADISETRALLEQVGANVIGAVLNNVYAARFRPSQFGRSPYAAPTQSAVGSTWSA
jgi:capsular exopolysaccharide synthesis family protein